MITAKTKNAYRLLHDGTLALARAEQQGIRVDVDYLEKKITHMDRKIERLESKFYATKFYRQWEHVMKRPNVYSNTQLATYLYRIKKIQPKKITTSGQGSTDEEALKELGIPEVNDLLSIRQLKKIRDTYLKGFMREQVNGVLHPSFNLHLVRTFRSSSDRPNFQNIPKRDKEAMEITRKALYPRVGHQLLEADYSGLEVSIAATYHKDSTMMKYLNDPSTDMHGDMAAQLFMIRGWDRHIKEYNHLRKAAKNGFVFPQFYGDYYKNCADGLVCKWGGLPHGKWKAGQGVSLPEGTLGDHLISKGLKSLDDFTEHVRKIESDFWKNRFPEYAAWKDRWWQLYQKYGYITMHTGFECSGEMRRNDCINYPVQGAAFHCLLWSFIELDKVLTQKGYNTKLIGQIHDAMILDVDPAELEDVIRIIRKVTCEDLPKAWSWINVPLNVDFEICDVDASWAEKRELT